MRLRLTGSVRALAVPTAVATLVSLVLAGCTSSTHKGQSTSPSVTTPSSAAPPPSIRSASGSTSPGAPSGLQTIRGALLLLGPAQARGAANVYEVGAGGLRQVTHVSGGGFGVSDITANARQLVVTDSRTRNGHIAELHGTTLRDLGTGTGFGPALSGTGALAWAAVEVSSKTPGITKPTSSVVQVRATLRGRARIVYRTTLSLGTPQWIGRHALVVPASDQESTRIVRVDTTAGTSRVLATVARADALDTTAGSASFTVADDNSATVVSLDGGTQHPIPSGWTPLCWSSARSLVAAHGGQLATIRITKGRPAAPEPIATLPSGLVADGASCARLGT